MSLCCIASLNQSGILKCEFTTISGDIVFFFYSEVCYVYFPSMQTCEVLVQRRSRGPAVILPSHLSRKGHFSDGLFVTVV